MNRIVLAASLVALFGAACDRNMTGSAEVDPTVSHGQAQSGVVASPHRWCNAARECPSPDRIHAREIPFERPGPEHCGWETATFIAFLDGQYVRDEIGTVTTVADVRYDPSAMLPPDARFTGWRRGDQELWLSPSELGGRFGVYLSIYIVRPDQVERLPHFDLVCV
jgi:hypothetical protein